MNSDKLIKRIVIVGNGFDLAHGLKTSYFNFAHKYRDNATIKQFHQYVDFLDAENPFVDENGEIKNITWYSFELNMERLITWNFQKEIGMGNIADNETIFNLNCIFADLEELLKKYLIEEYESVAITAKDSVQNCFDENTLAISFNYTDTIKLYANNYHYVHGSLSDDNYIILGLATGDIPCLCSGDYIHFQKDVRKEELSYLRYLRENGCNNVIKELDEFKRHAISLLGPRGEYDLEYKADEPEIYDTANLSLYLKEYAEKNKFTPEKEPYDYKAVEEVIVMGHGLESDIFYLGEIFEEIGKINKVILYSYNKEGKKEIDRKINVLKGLSGLKEIEIREY